MKDPVIKLAKESLQCYFTSGKIMEMPKDLPNNLQNKKAGVFVSYHKGQELRGCIGTMRATKTNLACEIIDNAVAAANDPRFEPLSKKELPQIKVKVDVLSAPRQTSEQKLDPRRYGVIVKSKDGRCGLLLPDLQGVDSSEKQLSICRQKAGIGPDEDIKIFCFTVERHEE